MGMDFVALMQYGGPDEPILRVLDRLEVESPVEIKTFAQCMHERGRWFGEEKTAVWKFAKRPELRDPRLEHRPALPNLGVFLQLQEGFFLTFGHDAVRVYHLLRWHAFLTEPELQRVMIDACLCLAHLFGATGCIITSDFSPVVHAFGEGMGFDAALASAGPEDGERARLADLYQELPTDQVLRFIDRPGQPRQTRYMDWDRDKPPPEGWQRATTWDSRGYWRLDLGARHSESSAFSPASTAVEEPMRQPPNRPGSLQDESWWATSDEPDAILDYLLKQDQAPWRKVQLWACACLRRIWPWLATEPVRRVVEVAEQFADRPSVRWPSVGKIRKGDRRANRAAELLAQMCAGDYRFPPGNVSEAVADVVAGEANDHSQRMAERRAHSDLLRDVFGPYPLRPRVVNPSWRTPTVRALAQSAYERRELPGGLLDTGTLAILGDALEESGCTDTAILAHLRSPGPHVRGCWAVDCLLGQDAIS
jgi:hypothetical protein